MCYNIGVGGGDGMKEILLAIRIEVLPEGGVLATSEELPGLVAQGRTIAETLEIAQDVARKLIESYREHGDELPPALKAATPRTGEVRIPVAVS
jgi:predicted RNase H-like HicB family nuclease